MSSDRSYHRHVCLSLQMYPYWCWEVPLTTSCDSALMMIYLMTIHHLPAKMIDLCYLDLWWQIHRMHSEVQRENLKTHQFSARKARWQKLWYWIAFLKVLWANIHRTLLNRSPHKSWLENFYCFYPKMMIFPVSSRKSIIIYVLIHWL